MKQILTLLTALLLTPPCLLGAADPFDPATIVGLMRQANDWQTAHPRMKPDDRNWERGTWFAGIMAAHKSTGDEMYLTQALDWGRQHQWQVGTEISGANKLFCSWTWLELFLLKGDKAMIQPTVNWLAANAPNSPGGAKVWFRHEPNHSDSPLYSDSLYAMPALALLHQVTGEKKYLEMLHHFSKAVTEELLDPQDGLYYRDRSFIGKRTPADRKVFWSRGNGWVFAGLPRTIECLPTDDPERARYVKLFKTLAAAIVKFQGADGLWRPNLADPDHIPAKETSGTAFFCYGIAWGIRNGLLDRETYLPVARKAWAALAASVNAEGMLQWGQQVGDRPAEVRQDQTHEYVTGAFLQAGSEMLALLSPRAKPDPLAESFFSPPDAARPGVYWYFMDGNQSREGMTADLEAMHRAGLRKALFLDVNIGVPRGPVNFMSEQWQDDFAHAVRTADRLGMEIILGTGPGWCGAGGPWIDPARSMQHLCASTAKVSGPGPFTGTLPVPEPRKPSEFAGLSPALAEKRQAWHADVTVLAFPTPAETAAPDLMDVRALYDTQPYSSYKHVTRFIPTHAAAEPPAAAVIDPSAILDLSQRLRPDGTLDWHVPPGAWTVMRFAARSTGATTRPAPDAGHGFESDRFDPAAFDYHFEQFHRKLMDKVGPRRAGRGWTALHLDSWESSSQNWNATLREEFKKRRGYEPQPYFPAYAGLIVGSRDKTERFLWDLRMTAAELVIEKHAGAIRQRAHENGFYYTSQFYDMNPAGDLDLGAVADIPSCEFWSGVLDTVYSCVEAASVAHTMGRPVVRAEAFTSMPQHGYRDNPADMKNQTDWALAIGINDFIIHTYQHQPLGLDGPRPGLAMGPHGIHWQRNQTFWPLVAPYHDYMARCGQMLRQGVSVADILYLTPEGAPHIFLAPEDAMSDGGLLRDKKGHGFDAVSPRILISRASVRDGMIAFEGGTSYRVLVMPLVGTMTPELLEKIQILIRDGATVIGTPPGRSPSLAGFPQCDERVKALATEIWGGVTEPAAEASRPFGKGRVVWGGETTRPGSADKVYPSYASTAAFLQKSGVPVVFESPTPLRWHQRRTPERDIFFVSNPAAGPVEATCVFRTDGAAPELWNAVDGSSRPLPEHTGSHGRMAVPLRLAANESCFVVFDRTTRDAAPAAGRNFAEMKTLAAIDGPWSVSFDAALGGPSGPVEFPTLSRWDSNPDDAVKYYSGQAVYRATFQAPVPPANARVFLDLGTVHKLARVTLNGADLGTVWTPPYRVEATGRLKPGPNHIEVAVVNTWVNRLIGDEQPANKGTRTLKWDDGMLGGTPHPAGRYTFTTARDYTAESPLQESGLLGPVKLLETGGLAVGAAENPRMAVQDRFQSLPPGAVRLSGFIQERIQQQSDYLFDEKALAEMTDAIRKQPHRIVNGGVTGLAEGEFWGKAVRALCHHYQYSGDPRLKKLLETTVADLLSLQTSDGNISDTVPELQPYHSDMWDRKYTLLGLVNAYETTRDPKVLQSAMRMADFTLSQVGPAPKVRIVDTSFHSTPSNPGGGMWGGVESSSFLEAIMRLYLVTGKAQYLDFARYIAEVEGCSKHGSIFEEILAGKDAKDLGGQKSHTYCVISCFEGLLEYYRATGNPKWKEAALKLYANIRAKENAIIGTCCGLGPFGGAWPVEQFNHSALYQTCPRIPGLEACSAPRWMALSQHLLRLTGDSLLADEYERSLYNAVWGSIRPDGKAVDYFTRLSGHRPDLSNNFRREFNGKSMTCCSYNVADLLAQVPFMAVMNGEGGPVVNLYIPGNAKMKLPDGTEVTIEQTTDYPKTGEVVLKISPNQVAHFSVRVRIPEWSKNTRVSVNGESVAAKPGTYLHMERLWKAGDTISLSLDMRCRLVRSPEGSPKSADGFRALVRGPLVLARDKRLGGDIQQEVDVVADADGIVPVTVVPSVIPALIQVAVPTVDGSSFPMIDFATSGNTWDAQSERVTWIPFSGGPETARWIWFSDAGNPAEQAPVGKRWFRTVLEVPDGRKIKQASVLMTADNVFTLFVNGRQVAAGNEWLKPVKADILADVKPGTLVLAVEAVNTEFSGPNPAGLLGCVRIEFTEGAPLVFCTGKGWKSCDREVAGWNETGFKDDLWTPARILGRNGITPWNPISEFGE